MVLWIEYAIPLTAAVSRYGTYQYQQAMKQQFGDFFLKFLFQKKEFDGWKTLNDTVMGGSSSAFCEISNSGLILKGTIVEKAGGFVSCRSPIY